MLAAALAALALTTPLTEAPHWPAHGDRELLCPEVTGAPGEVAISGDDDTVRFFSATRSGYAARGSLQLPGVCPDIVARPSGAAVIADDDFEHGLLAAVRDPGGAWSTLATLIHEHEWPTQDIQVAIADSGDAVVAWSEQRIDDDAYRLRVARRAPGQPFGPAETIGGIRRGPSAIWTGVANTGETFVLTASIESQRVPLNVPVRIAIAPRGAALPVPTGLAMAGYRSIPALAVAPDGRALVAIPDGTSVLVAERAPGEGFSTPVPVGPAADVVGVTANAALGAGGEAAVAWDGDEENGSGIVTRSGLGAFSPPVAITPRVPSTDDPFFTSQTFARLGEIGTDFSSDPKALTLTGDGRAALADFVWDESLGVVRMRASLTTLPLGGERAETQTFGGAIGLAEAVQPIVLADGTPALVWRERTGERSTLHLAAEGATAPQEPPTPRVRVGAPASPVTIPGDDLKLPVTCSAPCVVRAQAIGGSHATGRVTLPHGGRGTVKLETGSIPVARRRLGPVRFRITYGPPQTHQPRVKIVTFRLRRPADPPGARVVGLRAMRVEDTIRVTWRVRNAPGVQIYYVTGAETREWTGEPPAFDWVYSVRRRRSFALTLGNAAAVRWVTLRDGYGSFRLTVPVRSSA